MDDEYIIKTALINGNVQTIDDYYKSDPNLVADTISISGYIDPSLIDYLLGKFSVRWISYVFYTNNQVHAYYNLLNKTPYEESVVRYAIGKYVDNPNEKHREFLLTAIDAYESKMTFIDVIKLYDQYKDIYNDKIEYYCNVLSYIIFRIYDRETVKKLYLDEIETLLTILQLGGAPDDLYYSMSEYTGTYKRTPVDLDFDLFE